MAQKIGTGYVEIKAEMERLRGDLKTAQDRIAGSATTMESTYSKAFKRIGIAFAGIFTVGAISAGIKKSLTEFQAFESALTDMGKVTSRSFGELRAEVMAMPPELGSATDMMRGYYQVISAGVTDPIKSMEMLTASAKAAKTAHVEQSEVIKGFTKVMAGYEGQVRTAADAADLLFTIEKVGQTSVAELIPYIGSLAKISHDLGISQTELGGAFAQVTQLAGGTEEAATQYQAVLTALMKPSTELSTALKQMGFESAQAAIESLGFQQTLVKLSETTGGSQEKMAALYGNIRAIKGVAALSVNDFQNMADKIEQMGDKTGALDRAFEDWQKTLEASKEVFRNTVGKVLIEIGEQLAPTVISAMKSIGDSIRDNKDVFIVLAKASIVTLEGIIDLCSAVAKAFFTLSDAILLTVDIFKTWGKNAVKAIEDVANALPQAVTEADLFTESTNKASDGIDGMLKSAHESNKEIGLMAAHTTTASGAIKTATTNTKAFHDAQKNLNKSTETSTKLTKEQQKAIEDATKKQQAYIEKLALSNSQYSDNLKEETLLAKKQMDLTAADYAKHNALMTEFRKNQSEEINKISAEEASARIQLEEKALSSMTRSNDKYFEYKKNSLDRELKQYTDLYGEQTWITEAFAQKYIDLEYEKMRASNNFFAGVSAGFYDITKDMITWGDIGYETIKTFASAGSSAMSASFFAIIKGDIDSLSDIWSSFLDTMLKKFTDMLAEMIMQWAMSGLADLLSGKGFSGFSLPNIGSNLANYLGLGEASSITMGEVASQGGLSTEGLHEALSSAGYNLGSATTFGTLTMGEVASQAGLTQAGLHEVLNSATYSATEAGATWSTGLSTGLPLLGLAMAPSILGPSITSFIHDLLGGYEGVTFYDKLLANQMGLTYVPGFPEAGNPQDLTDSEIVKYLKAIADFMWRQVPGGDSGGDFGDKPFLDFDSAYALQQFNSGVPFEQMLRDMVQEQAVEYQNSISNPWVNPDSSYMHQAGGVLTRNKMLFLPSMPGGEGAFLGAPGEGVVSNRGMKTLDEINSGTFGDRIINAINSASGGSDRPIQVLVQVDGDTLIDVIAKRGPKDAGFRQAIGGIVN